MKTRIKKIIITAVALLFVSVGVSFAHDGNREHHKTRGNAHGHYKKGYDDQYGWHHKHLRKHGHDHRHYKKWRRHHHRWHKKHSRHRHYPHKRHHYREVHRVKRHYHHPRLPHKGNIFGFKLKEPGFKFAVVIKDR